jgi:hypothetical protein
MNHENCHIFRHISLHPGYATFLLLLLLLKREAEQQ